MEQNSVNEGISLALTTLRNEMAELRSQDVKLMKQLLHINNKISSLTKNSRTRRASKERRCISSCMISTIVKDKNQCQRRLSVPHYGTPISSSTSEDSLCSDNDLSESDEDSPIRSPYMPRHSSFLSMSDSDSAISDENLFKANIRVWKLSQTDLSV